MMNQDNFFMNDPTSDPNQDFFNLPDLSSLPTFNNFNHQQNLALLAEDLLNESKKFENIKQEENEDDNDDESESDSEEESLDQNVQLNQQNNNNNVNLQTKKRKLNAKNGEKKKAKSQYQRKNIKKIIGENKLNESTLKALQEEQERQMRLNMDLYKNAQKCQEEVFNKSSSDQSVLILEDEETQSNYKLSQNINEQLVKRLDCINRLNKDFLEKEKQIEYEDLTQSDNELTNDYSKTLDDDDDCRILSESEHQQEEAVKKKIHRGIHMNDELNRPDQNGQVLVNLNHPPEDPDIFLLPFLARNIKSHQIGGIRFIYDNIIESLSRVRDNQSGFGCILAHAMGLGKTFQIITFIEIFLRCTTSKRVLCIVPINTIQNWMSEFNNWLPEDGQQKLDNDTIINYKRPFKVYLINDMAKTIKQRTEIILDWKTNGGVLLIGYEMFRTLVCLKQNLNAKKTPSKKLNSNSSNQNLSKYMKQKESEIDLIDLEQIEIQLNKQNEIEEALLTPCLVVCDEGHRIKNSSANIAKTLQRIQTKRRIVLTGYPLQNNLIEYWCMVDFVRPSYLGNKAEFSNMFERPIMNGQCVDSTRDDVKLMRYRAHVLHSLLEGFVQRRGHDVFICSLPKKYEFIIQLKLSSAQKELYLAFMQAIGAMNPGEKTNPLRTFAICCKIWNHPDVLYKYNQDKETDLDLDLPDIQQAKIKRENSKSQFIQASTSCVIQEDQGFNPFAYTESRYSKSSFDPDWANKILETYTPDQLENGAKLILSFSIIEESVKLGDKILLFSQSLLTLNLIEEYLQRFNVPNTNQKWQKYKSYYRLDGSTNGTEREKLINSFNKQNNGVWLFLLSTRAGCLGINLIGANRVIVLDVSWNPCHDAQAVCRVFRYGQTKNSYIYRLIADHTMEKKIYDRQISKQTMSDRVIDEIQSENHFTRTEVEKLIHYVKEDTPSADLSLLPYKFEDPVLIRACLKHANVITKEPFTHESLLIDKKEYQLSEREKAMAFREYQHDKRYFPYSRSNSLFYSNRYNYLPHSVSSVNLSSYSSSARAPSSTSITETVYESVQTKSEPILEPVQENMPQQTIQPSQSSLNQLKDVKITSFTASSQISIPTSNNDFQNITIQPGEKVYLLKTPKGCYLRTPDKRYIALRNKSIEDSIMFGDSNNLTSQDNQQFQQQYPTQESQIYNYNTTNFNQNMNYYYQQPIQNGSIDNSYIQQFSNTAYQAPNGLVSTSTSLAESNTISNFNPDLPILSADMFQTQMLSVLQPMPKEN